MGNMDFNSNNIPSGGVFNASKPSFPQLGRAVIMDRENTSLAQTGMHEWLDQYNMSKNVSALGMNGNPKHKKSIPLKNGNSSITSPRKIIGKRGPPPEDINTPSERQKKRRIDVAQGLEAGTTFSNGLAPTKRGPRIADLLPIQHESWFYLPEMWEYCGPDGQRIRERRWSPSHGGDHTTTNVSDRLHQNGDRNNATAATVATWAELNRLRARYQQLVAEFHGGPLVVHHLADKESEEKLAAIELASAGLEKAMAGVGRAAPSRPRLSWAMAPVTASEQVKRQIRALAPQTSTQIFVSPLDTLLHVEPVEKAVSTQEHTPTPILATLPTIPPASLSPPSYEPSEKAGPSSPIAREEEAPIAPSDGSSSTKGTKRRQKVTRLPKSAMHPSVASTSSNTNSFVSTAGQFRFTAGDEALFKLLAQQRKYDEAFAMLPAEQQFMHLTTPEAIAEFRSTHPRANKGGEDQKDETELWVCKAKVRLEKRELPRANKSEAPQYELQVVYSDAPCNGTGTRHDSEVRHKKRTHLMRPYQYNATN